MPDYIPPVETMKLLLSHVTPLPEEAGIPADMVGAVLEEAAKLARGVIAPLNETGDRAGCVLENGVVRTASGFREAYRQYREGGWNAVPFDPAYGGQGLPWLLSFPVQEMWQSGSLSFGLCPLLNQGAVEAIASHGSPEQKDLYLPRLISGEWTGTMNLTEPHAGSDLGLIRTSAQRQDDGSYRIFGQKIFITYGEHDLAENIIHLVLARLPDAPEGVKGISLFIVPKFLTDANGSLRERNDLACVGIEHKLGIHASPTCTMQFGDCEGDRKGAIGYLVGEENQGLKYMFTMMNNARLSVGLQGVAVAERATQAAHVYAADRKQGKAGDELISIDRHPDVRRMLMTMRALTLAGRALSYQAAMYLDRANAGDQDARARVDLLTPVVKSWCTDNAVEVASLGIQVHGGMGFIEETGAAQYYRDARILPIYEGTNGIQASDFLFRKILRDEGAAFGSWIADLEKEQDADLRDAVARLKTLGQLVLDNKSRIDDLAFIASDLLNSAGIIAGGVLTAHIARADPENYHDLFVFYKNRILTRILSLEASITKVLKGK